MAITMFPAGVRINQLTKDNIKQYCYPEPLKDKGNILCILNHYRNPEIVGFLPAKDPIDGDIIGTARIVYEEFGLTWTNSDIYLFEKYDLKLNDEFLDGVRTTLKKNLLISRFDKSGKGE